MKQQGWALPLPRLLERSLQATAAAKAGGGGGGHV